MTVFLYPNQTKDTDLSVTRSAAELLRGFGVRVLMDPAYASIIGPCAEYTDCRDGISVSDLVVTVGGDGTLLRAAADCLSCNKPVLGVNLGRTGFLATCEVPQMEEKFRRLSKGQYHLEYRTLLQAEVPGDTWQALAVNDVVLYGRSRLHPMDFVVYCDGICVGNFRSDGVIVSTPTGSTAYSLSAGGPILDVTSQVFVMSAICPHGGQLAPLVFSPQRRLRILSAPENRDVVLACADSRTSHTLAPGESIDILNAAQTLAYAVFDDAEQFRAIENKLTRR